jgi:2'-5' RNA ligase
VRLFLAIDPGAECRRQLSIAIDGLRLQASGIRWVREDQLHFTLAFLGEVEDARVAGISESMHAVAARHYAFPASVSGSGVFPDWRRPRVVWLGCIDGGELDALGADVGRACASLGFPPERAFKAHLTIGRAQQPLGAEERDALGNALRGFTESYAFQVNRIVLMRSTLSPKGSRYSEVATYPLRSP